MTELDGHPTSLGRGTGVLTWLVDPQQSDRLASIGSVAELWLEGPLVGSGYYNDPARTNATFVVNPPWMTRNRPGQLGRTGRAYRTGDLVRYQDDGSLEFIGRATTQQVKIRGQRVELGDVQHHVRQILRKKDPDVQVIADVAGEKRKILVAFVWSPVKAWTDASFESRIQILKQTAGNIKRELAGVIPSYMVPVLFVPVAEIPKTVSGKMDRRKLQVVLLDLDMKQRDACLLDSRESTSSPARPMTSPEKQLASLWAAALNIPEDDIGIDDNFFNRGGDSISAMRLVNAARKHQVVISVKDIWDHPQLKDLAVHMTQNQVEAKAPSDIATGAAPVNRSPASGPLPVTYFQGLSLTGLLGGYSAHVYHILIDIPAETKTEQVRASCLKLFQHFDILRARFACTLQRTWQYLDAEDSPLPWEVVEADSNKGLESATKQVCSKNSGAPQTQYPDARSYLTRFVFVQASQHDASSRLILRLSHAQYDGISLPRMLAALADYLRDGTSLVPAPRYADYIQHVFSQNPAAAYEYWRGLLEGADSPTVLPACHRQDANDVQLLQVSRIIQEPSPHGNEIAQQQTPAVRFMAACAAMLSQATSRQDVVFGCIVSGRTSLPAALREVCGPCLNEIALRVAFPHSSSSSPLPQAAYSQIRNQLLDSAAYDTVGFDEIAAHCTSWAPDTDDFGLTAHYQNTGSEHDTARLPYTWYEADRAKDGLPVPKSDYVEVEGTPLADGRVSVCVMGKSSLYTLDFLQHLLDMVCDGLRA
ncbi:putative NRPS-like protein biosynthetic cluster [Exserohilum turcicum]